MVGFYAAQVIFLLERMFLCLLCNKEALTSPTPRRIAQEYIEVCLLADPERLSSPARKAQAEATFRDAVAAAAVTPSGARAAGSARSVRTAFPAASVRFVRRSGAFPFRDR